MLAPGLVSVTFAVDAVLTGFFVRFDSWRSAPVASA
jgi:hypothetical protein